MNYNGDPHNEVAGIFSLLMLCKCNLVITLAPLLFCPRLTDSIEGPCEMSNECFTEEIFSH